MAREIHYEVFRRGGAKGGCTLHEVTGARTRALNQAKELMATDQATGVKVVKETYNEESGDYLTLKIFEDGRNVMKVSAAKEEPPQALPCFKPDDLYFLIFPPPKPRPRFFFFFLLPTTKTTN